MARSHWLTCLSIILTLLAAHDRDWARVPAQSGAKNVELRLQTPAAADRAQAMARLLKLNGASAETLFANWEILGAAGVEQYIRRNGPPRAQIVALFGAELARREPAAFLNRAPELLQAMQGDPDAGEAREDLEAQLYLSRAATGAATNDAAARAEINGWLDEQKEIKREINARSVTRLLQMAAIAGKLKRQDAGQWLDYAAALATQLGSARGAESAWSEGEKQRLRIPAGDDEAPQALHYVTDRVEVRYGSEPVSLDQISRQVDRGEEYSHEEQREEALHRLPRTRPERQYRPQSTEPQRDEHTQSDKHQHPQEPGLYSHPSEESNREKNDTLDDAERYNAGEHPGE